MAAAMVALATTTLGTSASTVTFGSIPATYRDLRLVIHGASSINSTAQAVLSGDTGANYTYVNMYGTGSVAGSGYSTTNLNAAYFGYPDTAGGVLTADWLDYSATDKHKTYITRSSNAGQYAAAIAGRWASTSAITSMALSLTSGNWSAGTTFSLFGIVS